LKIASAVWVQVVVDGAARAVDGNFFTFNL